MTINREYIVSIPHEAKLNSVDGGAFVHALQETYGNTEALTALNLMLYRWEPQLNDGRMGQFQERVRGSIQGSNLLDESDQRYIANCVQLFMNGQLSQ